MTFIEATTCFADPRELTKCDEKDSIIEGRFVTIGLSAQGLLHLFAHTDDGIVIRIISARRATRVEARQYTQPRR